MLRTVLVPMALPGLRTAFAFSFLLAAGDFVTPSLVGGSQSLLIGNIVADQFRGIGSNWPLGAAMAFVVVAVMLVCYLAVARLIRWGTRW
jgi:spermidine/putrescine transport system permease protein